LNDADARRVALVRSQRNAHTIHPLAV